MLPAAVLQSQSPILIDWAAMVPLFVWQLFLVLGALVSVAVLYRVARPGGQWARRARSRLILGVPWGTLTAVAFVFAVYLFVQGGIEQLRDPVTYAFQATGYAYPLGVITASFAHTSFGHFFGNMLGTLVFGTIAEYGFSHFPTRRGSSTYAEWRTNPFVRVVVFVVGIIVAGLVFGAFSWGPVIGFSGVVFALAGFALVVRPVPAVLGLLIAESNLPTLVYNAFNNPVSTLQPTPSSGSVWFANIAVQGHLYGFLIGVVVGAVILRLRNERPDVSRVFLGGLVYGAAQGLWVFYWFLGNGRYVLFRTIGVVFIFGLAAVLVVTVARIERPLLPDISIRDWSLAEQGPSKWQTAVGAMVIVLLSMSLVGGVLNLVTIQGSDLPNDPVEVRDYTVGYSENTTNELLAVVDIPGVGDVGSVQASGVIVASEQRNIWQVHTTKNRLAFRGFARVTLGGPGWREEVLVTRTGWSVVGGGTTYRVRLHTDEIRRTVFTSGEVDSAVVIANRTTTMETVGEQFRIGVRRGNETVDAAELPADGGNVTVGGITYRRDGKKLFATYQGTRVQVATKKEPRNQQYRDR